ncbi:MAG: cation diffusion facilitator family transporter [Candidatus Cloacimonas sp.]|jgi:cobalt-zinc-cadmium efflux system protein|nr:cation diffusion facilitator family transporter [Candidatus Cloacimonas sp.]
MDDKNPKSLNDQNQTTDAGYLKQVVPEIEPKHTHTHVEAELISPAKFRFVTLLNLIITIAEFVGGIVSGSLALLSDAVHNLSDTVSILISYFAFKIAKRDNDYKHTFGYQRAEILAAFINATALVVISIFLIYEAIQRFYHPSVIKGYVMLIVASIGLISNFISVLLLHFGSKENINIRSSYLHMLGDTFSSVGVIVGGIAIVIWKVYWIDPIITILVALYIAKESIEIIKTSTHIIMQGAPDISIPNLQKDLEAIEGIDNLHHVHTWMMNDKSVFLEAHIDVPDQMLSQLQPLLENISYILESKYAIDHITIQFECDSCVNKDLVFHKTNK